MGAPMSKNRRIRDTSESTRVGSSDRGREVVGVIGLGASLFLLIAMVSLQTGGLAMGPFGRTSAGVVYALAGVCGYLVIALAVVASVRMLIENERVMPLTVTIGTLIGVISAATLIHL